MPARQMAAFYAAAEVATADPCLGLKMAENFPRGTWPELEFGFQFAENVRSSLRSLASSLILYDDMILSSFSDYGDHSAFEAYVPSLPEGYGRLSNCFLVAGLVLLTRKYTGVAGWTPARVDFAHQEPGDVDRLLRFLGTTNVTFGASRNRIVVKANFLEQPFLTSDPAVANHFASRIEGMGVAPSRRNPLLAYARQSVVEAISRGEAPQLEGSALALGLSPRSLQRRLLDAGTSFDAEVDQARREFALMYLEEGRLSVTEVALALGYSEHSAFSRAFRRWTGLSPLQYQRARGLRR